MLTPCSPSLPKPRIFIYDLPRRVLPRQGNWRLTVDLPRWLASSPFVETSGECADYYLVPSYPHNCVSDRKGQLCGDGNTARAFDYIRTRWPWWNRTARLGVARHVMLLPCDDGPGGRLRSAARAQHKQVVAGRDAAGRGGRAQPVDGQVR